jgi:hypothetical protein
MSEIAATMPVRRPVRRTFLGSQPRAFSSPLSAADALARLRAALARDGLVGEVEPAGAKVRARPAAWPPHPFLRLTVVDGPEGCEITARFDASPLDEADFAVYILVAVLGFSMTSAWSRAGMPPHFRMFLAGAVPAILAFLAAVAIGHFAFRRWRQGARDRAFDVAMRALGVEDP